MTERPNTISDAEWTRLQKAAAEAAGGLIKNAGQQRLAQRWTEQRDNSRSN